MLAVASLWKASAFEVLEVIDQIVATVNKLCRFLDRKAIGVLLTQLTLVELDGCNPRVFQNRRPWFLLIELASDWLLVNEVKTVMELVKSNLTRKACEGLVHGVIVLLPCAIVEDFIQTQTSTKGAAHGCHDTDLGCSLVAILPTCDLLIILSEVNICNEVKVGSGGDP